MDLLKNNPNMANNSDCDFYTKFAYK